MGLTAFHKFDDTKAAMEACTELTEGTVGKSLKKFLKKMLGERETDQGRPIWSSKSTIYNI